MRGNLDDYVQVHERVTKFRQEHPKGRIITVIVGTDPFTVRAEVYQGGEEHPWATGHASEEGGMKGNRKDSTTEKCETAAVGRALAFCGYEIKKGIASKEEVEKAIDHKEAEERAMTQDREARAFLKTLDGHTDDADMRAKGKEFMKACSESGKWWSMVALEAKKSNVKTWGALMAMAAFSDEVGAEA